MLGGHKAFWLEGRPSPPDRLLSSAYLNYRGLHAEVAVPTMEPAAGDQKLPGSMGEAPGRGSKIKVKIKGASQPAPTAVAPALAAPQASIQQTITAPQANQASREVDDSLLDDSDEDAVPSTKRRAGAPGSAQRRAAVLDDEDEDQVPAMLQRTAKATTSAVPTYVLDSDGDEPAVKKPRLKAAVKPPKPSPASSSQAAPPRPGPAAAMRPSAQGSASAAAGGGGRRSARERRPSERAFGAEEGDYDPDDLEALQAMEQDDEDVIPGESEAEEDDDMDMGDAGGRGRRRGSAKAKGTSGGGGRKGKTAPVYVETDGCRELVPAAMGQTDFSYLSLKADHASRPLWATPDGHIILETFSPVYKQAQDFLVAIAEPVCRPECVHEYQLTPHSLYAAVSVGLDTDTIISVLGRLSKVHLDEGLKQFIIAATRNYGKVKLVLKRNHFYVETSDLDVFEVLTRDAVIASARVGTEVLTEKALKERAVASITRVTQSDLVAAPPGPSTSTARPTAAASAASGASAQRAPPGSAANTLPAAAAATQGAVAAPGFFGSGDARGQAKGAKAGAAGVGEEEVREGGRLSIDDVEEGEEDEGKVVRSFEIKGDMVESVKKRCMPGVGSLNYPMLEEYDFRGDRNTPDLNVELRPMVKLRPYQEKSLSKMFGNGRARSGIIVLPCGAGKSLVGVAAAARVRKSCLCLCTSSVSVDQWKHQFMLWTNLQDHQIARFTSDSKEQFAGAAGIVITTFTMIAFSGKRSAESEKVMELIRSREWGMLLMDEVHVVPAQMFRKVIGIIHSHCKLGLTATLVREDELIGDLNFLIGPKLYEANWLDLTRAGHIANVQCVEVWCPMTREFYKEYLKPENSGRKQLLYCMNPAKFMACQFLINWHERERKDKVIVFSDNIWALREYATRMQRPFIYGPTSHAERTRVLHAFKNDPNVNTIFLSKVGDNSLDIPEANVLIQISSHAGSRRQEAQRLGRILRAKRAKAGPVNTSEFNAFFYTLVSQDTQEMYYSTKRQQFLIDQGYAFKVVTNLVDTAVEATDGNLMFSKREEQLDLLCRVLTAGLDEAGVEVGARDHDEEELAQAYGKSGVRRSAGDMRALTGAAGLRYQEYRAEAGPAAAYALPTAPTAGRGHKVKASDASKKYQKALGLAKK